MEHVYCEVCGLDKPAQKFPRGKRKDGTTRVGKTCHSCLWKRRVSANPGLVNEKKRKYYHNNKESHKKWYFEYKYGLSFDDYSKLISQGCEVCGTHENLHVDHDHDCCSNNNKTCGKCIRGVLCSHCNRAEGLLRSDPNLAVSLAAYMLKTQNVLESL